MEAKLFFGFLSCHPKGMDLNNIMNTMAHISILSGAQDYYFKFLSKAATFQYFGGPCLFSVLLRSSQSRFLPLQGLALPS